MFVLIGNYVSPLSVIVKVLGSYEAFLTPSLPFESYPSLICPLYALKIIHFIVVLDLQWFLCFLLLPSLPREVYFLLLCYVSTLTSKGSLSPSCELQRWLYLSKLSQENIHKRYSSSEGISRLCANKVEEVGALLLPSRTSTSFAFLTLLLFSLLPGLLNSELWTLLTLLICLYFVRFDRNWYSPLLYVRKRTVIAPRPSEVGFITWTCPDCPLTLTIAKLLSFSPQNVLFHCIYGFWVDFHCLSSFLSPTKESYYVPFLIESRSPTL